MLAEQAQRRVGGQRWWQNFERDVELGGFSLSAVTLAGWTVIGGILGSIAFALALQSLWGLLIGLIAPVLMRFVVRVRVSRKRAAFGEQLPDNLDVLAGSLRAGHSLIGAMSVMMEGADQPSRTEFRRVIQDEQLGVPIDQALMVMMQRMEIRRLIRVLTAQGRLAMWILMAMPIALTGFILLINPSHLNPLFERTIGNAFLVAWFVMMVAGYFVIKKIVKIDL